jgi:signal transduction histidine kinase
LGADLLSVLLVLLGASFFSVWIFNIIENRENEIESRNTQLQALHSAALSLTTELDLQQVLQKVVQLSRELVNARYGALGVLNEQGDYIEQFITDGITPEQRALLGEPPRGHGVLGLIIQEGKAIRLPSISAHPQSVGFPPNHPPMHSLLGVPIQSKGKVIGDLYMTDKVPDAASNNIEGFTEFTAQDQRLLEMFATQAAIAIENAQLYRKTQQLAILEERDRFAMDLHDGIIQSIYATGLALENAQHTVEHDPEEATSQINTSILGLNDVIRDIRNYILGLRPQRFEGRDLVTGLEELARDLRANTFLNVQVEHKSGDFSGLPAEQTVEILHIGQEALANIRKHARASEVTIRLSQQNGELVLDIKDDGVGFDDTQMGDSAGHGLLNMKERARSLMGEIEVRAESNKGARIILKVPYLRQLE